MQLEWISLRDFRSYQELEWSPTPGINILVGPNGSGKTNLVEGVSYLSRLTSIRGAADSDLIKTGADRSIVRGSLRTGNREHTAAEASQLVEVELPRSGRKRVLLNRNPAKPIAVRQASTVVGFIPEDLERVKGGPGLRRSLLDDTAEDLWSAAQASRAEFERALKQRNAFLRQRQTDPPTLAVWDRRFAQAVGKLMSFRIRAAELLQIESSRYYRQISGEETGILLEYRSEWAQGLSPSSSVGWFEEMMLESLDRNRTQDAELGLTSTGPHRDDPVLLIGDRDSRRQASQGEQRSLTLSLCLGRFAVIAEHLRQLPILMLDDAFSEIDPYRAQRLAQTIPSAQVFITTARLEEVPLSAQVWSLPLTEPGPSMSTQKGEEE